MTVTGTGTAAECFDFNACFHLQFIILKFIVHDFAFEYARVTLLGYFQPV